MNIKDRLKWQIKRYNDISKMITGKTQNKKAYIIYTKRQHKKIKQNEKKMLTRRAGYVIILLSQGEKKKIEIESKTETKVG